MEESVNIKLLSFRLVLFFIVLLVTSPVLLIFYDLVFLRSQPSAPYKRTSVEQLCQIFDIPSTDDFCVHADEQTWYMFEAALKRRFPKGQATFEQIMSNLEVTYTDFAQEPKKYPTSEAIASTYIGFAGGNCPSRAVLVDIYTCYVYFKEDIRRTRFVFERDSDVIFIISVGHTGS